MSEPEKPRGRSRDKSARSMATKKEIVTQSAAEAAFHEFRDNKVEYCAFAGGLAGGQAFEIWYVDGEWCTSFVVLYPDQPPRFFESIQVLLHEINLINQLDQERRALATDRRLRLCVGSFAFLAALGVVLWNSRSPTPGTSNIAIVAAIVGVLASGCVAIFGVWVPSSISNRVVRLLDAAPQTRNGGNIAH